MRDAVQAVYLEAAAAAEAAEVPEAVSVIVDTRGYPGVDPAVVAPLVARVLFPGRAFGETLHVESGPERGIFYVDVEALRPSLLSANIGRPMPAER